jgi:hypothetical protein
MYYNRSMATTVQARLDDEIQADLENLAKTLGVSQSEVLREGIRLMKEKHKPQPRKKLIGVGIFSSGLTDLSTNPKYMEGFGRDNEHFSSKPPAKSRNR